MDEIINRINKLIESDSSDILVDENSYRFDESNFNEVMDVKSKKTISFIDGGNLELVKSPSFSVFFNRIFASAYSGTKKLSSNFIEFYTLIVARPDGKKIYYDAECFGIDIKHSFDSRDSTLASSSSRADISLIGNVIRRYAELKVADESDSDCIVLDGSLEKKYTYEDIYLDKLKSKKLFGLSKTNDILTGNGTSASALLFKKKNGIWAYKVSDHFYFLKLHDKSEYVFKFECLGNNNLHEVLSMLKENSKDIIFPGYPYALIEADRFARVSENEKNSLQMRLMLILGDKIRPFLNNSNAHDML